MSSGVTNQEFAISETTQLLRQLVEIGGISDSVLAELLPNGAPHDFETALWDYKLSIPILPERPNEVERKAHKAALGEIIKDVVSFHNAYGGYILFGIADTGGNRVKGCETVLDCGDLNNRIQSYTQKHIECLYRAIAIPDYSPATKVGLLYIPRRPDGAPPVRFIKQGPEKPGGGRCFQAETYVRMLDQCRPAAATSDDWQFLHSARSLLSPTRFVTRPQVRSSLPARDPDLIEFVGRAQFLGQLRSWLLDDKSPVRLITGIGGLGKTTLAYGFAEEVTRTAAGDIEWVIWLTAKQRTFSALLGELVPIGKVDFDDQISLLKALLRILSYDIPADEDEVSLDEYVERLIEALSIYSCLIIVDDIDTLQPDAQKEIVATLSSIASRTIGREIPPSKILMTSRIDQGVPKTSVVKITGLEQRDFAKHVRNVCDLFDVQPLHEPIIQKLFEATSGSPLFASSIIRLISLGENVRTAIDVWEGQEGEEARKFAFEREIKRLSTPQARLLYAVLLLGQSSIADLAAALEIPPKAAQDHVSQLQAYHLIATTITEVGDSVIIAPSDLVSVLPIIRSHLGTHARMVEEACARLHERGETSSREIGVGIRQVLNEWSKERFSEALILAKNLQARFPKSGDVAMMLGTAHLKLRPSNFREADVWLTAAGKLGCTRPELIPYSINAKVGLEDWLGLFTLTKGLSSNSATRDISLEAFINSCRKLISIAKASGRYERIESYATDAISKIESKISRQLLDQSYFQALKSAQYDFAREYVRASEFLHPKSGDKLYVFEAVAWLSELNILLSDLVKVGLDSLRSWWSDVENRPFVDSQACSILASKLVQLEKIESRIQAKLPANSNLLSRLSEGRRDLAFRGAKLRDSL